MLVRNEYVPLLGLSKKYLDASRFYPNPMVEITLEIVLAGAYTALSDNGKAFSHLKHALELALPDGIIMPFVELYEHIGTLLEEIARENNVDEINKIMSLSAEFKKRLRAMRDTLRLTMQKNLTQQEKKIIEMLMEDYSNNEIAQALYIRETTVKTHLSHLFNKFGVKKRNELKEYLRHRAGNLTQKLKTESQLFGG
jgi:LuxR family maltose regulon positive regulatory protein